MLVLHYTGMVDAESAIARLRTPAAAVSAHYVVLEDGGVLALIDEERTAWHAGISCWCGRQLVNARSVGIEIVNGGHDFGLPAYPQAQLEAVAELARDVVRRWSIAPANVVGHSDIAPMRKRDPGERFPWSRLAAAGIGLWPEDDATGAPAPVTSALTSIGYGLDDAPVPTSISAALQAFQRRFMPGRPIDGRDDEATRLRLAQVAAAHALARAVERAYI